LAEDLRRNLAHFGDRGPGGKPSHELDFPPVPAVLGVTMGVPKLAGEVEPGLPGKNTGRSAVGERLPAAARSLKVVRAR